MTYSTFSKYKYSFTLLVSLLIAIILYFTGLLEGLTTHLYQFAYASAYISGFLSSFSITAATASLYFIELGKHYHLPTIIVLGAFGSMTADMLLYRFMRSGILSELKALSLTLLPEAHRELMERITKHRVFLWTVPFFASILIASPLPNEVGISLFALINFRPKYLSIVTFLLNLIGIAILVYIGHTIA